MGSGFTEATVFIHGSEAHYRRTGAGGTVVVLVGDASLGDRLSRSLARRFRVILPDEPAHGRPFEQVLGTVERVPGVSAGSAHWLRGLLVGLGIEVAGLVVDEAWSLAALRLALVEPDRIDRLALLVDAAGPAMPRAGIVDRLESTGQRLLMIDGRIEGKGADRIAAFLGGA